MPSRDSDSAAVSQNVSPSLRENDWLITVIREHPKRLGGWKIYYCCPPRIWRALIV